MLTIIFITFCFYLIAELVKQGSARKAQKREMARQAQIEAEMRRDREQRERIAREQKEQREAMIAYEKEMRRLHLEQIREEKERQRLEAEQARQAAMLQRHEERISKLEYRVQTAEENILFLTDTIETLETLRHPLAMELQRLKNQRKKNQYNGIEDTRIDKSITTLTKQVMQYDNKIHSARQKISKAEHDKAEAERQLSAA